MSTKIHYGFQLRARDLRQVLDELAEVQNKAAAILVQREATFLAVTAASRLDRMALFGLAGYSKPWALNEYSALSSASDELHERQGKIRLTRRRDPDVDFEVVFRLWLSRDTGTFIGYVMAESASDFRQLLMEAGLADEYAYWNNTDPEDGVTEEEWEHRGKVWDNVIKGKSGPWFDIRVEEPFGGWGVSDDILAALPTLEQRINLHANAIAFNGWAQAKIARHAETGLPDSSETIAKYFDFYDKLSDGDAEVTALLQQAKEDVRARLAPVITEAMLVARG